MNRAQRRAVRDRQQFLDEMLEEFGIHVFVGACHLMQKVELIGENKRVGEEEVGKWITRLSLEGLKILRDAAQVYAEAKIEEVPIEQTPLGWN